MSRATTERLVAVAILAKAPIPRLAKTRLIQHLGAAGAAALQHWLLRRTVATALAADLGPVTLWCAPDTSHPAFAEWQAREGITLRRQPDGDLGERMLVAIDQSGHPLPPLQGEGRGGDGVGMAVHQMQLPTDLPHPPPGLPLEGGGVDARSIRAISPASFAATLVIGTDCPLLTPELLQEAAAALGGHDAVLVPAEDGGYVLIGLRRAVPAVFADIDWSTERVMAQTRDRLQAAGLSWRELPPLWDVDRAEDVGRLIRLFPEAVLP